MSACVTACQAGISQPHSCSCPSQGRKAKDVKDGLAARGIMVRHYAKKELCGYVRISVGRPEHTDALMKVLQEL